MRVLEVRILTPEGPLFEGQARLVEVPGADGRFSMMFQHAPIVARLQRGILRVVLPDGENRHFLIQEGVVHCAWNQVSALVIPVEANES